MNISNRYCWILVILLIGNRTFSQGKFNQLVDELNQSEVLQTASWSIYVKDLNDGRALVDYEGEKSLIPASALKVLTTASGLALLGPDFRFKTEMYYVGNIDDNGNLNGDVVIKGYGDPTLGSDQFDEADELDALAENFRLALQRKGIRTISGTIMVDASYCSSAIAAPSWQWSDLGNYYGSGAWGLNIHENLYYLKFRQNPRLGASPSIASVQPLVDELNFRNELTSAPRGTGDNAYIYGSPYTNLKYIRGTIPVGNQIFSIKGALPNPPLFFAQYLEKKLREIGIEVGNRATTFEQLKQTGTKEAINYESSKLLYRHESPTLVKIIERANQKSVNLYCEAILKVLGKEKKSAGTTNAGLEVIESYWSQKGLDFTGVFLEDGSGLSARNGVSAAFLTNLMHLIAQDEVLYGFFEPSLPVAGQSGTLKRFMSETSLKGNLRAKSGTISRVKSYTGYLKSVNKKPLAFTVIVNNYNGKSSLVNRQISKLLMALYREEF